MAAGGVVHAALAEELVAWAREQGVELLGQNGLLRQKAKAVVERVPGRGADRAPGLRAQRAPGGQAP